MPHVFLGEAKDPANGGGRPGVTTGVAFAVEQRRVVAGAVDLEDEIGARHDDVDATDPVVVAEANLATGGDAGVVTGMPSGTVV